MLSLISHTNAGKTTLARTLLRKDIGDVADRPHVTDEAEMHVMLQTEDGTTVNLWDTPGFGDTARLLRRLKMSRNPIGWVLTQVWDRFADRPLWCSQQAVKNVRENAEVVLYLVNAAEHPETAAYVAMEMEILSYIGKPVIVLLNQTGPVRSDDEEQEDLRIWKEHLKRFVIVKRSLPLDAFARCWVQEEQLLAAIQPLVRDRKRPAFEAAQTEWRRRNLAVFEESMAALGRYLGETIRDREALPAGSLSDKLRDLARFHRKGMGDMSTKEAAMAAMAERLELRVRRLMDELLDVHELEGEAAKVIQERLEKDFASNASVNAGMASVLGGMLSGALGGVLADFAAGGLTFGGGAVLGGFIGAASAAGLAKGFNLVRGTAVPSLRWSQEFIEGLFRSASLRYLAVAHFGRGRGAFNDSEHPEFWKSPVEERTEWIHGRLKGVVEMEPDRGEQIDDSCRQVYRDLIRDLFLGRYPESARVFGLPAPPDRPTPEALPEIADEKTA